MEIVNERYREYKLNNGLVVILQNTPTQTIAAKLRVNYGPLHERAGEEGMAHLLEHCLFLGGSQKYDPVQADELRGSIEYSNVFTSIDDISFVGGMLSENLEKWLDFASQHVFYPRFEQNRVNKERERILCEISDEKSSPNYEAKKEFNKLFYRGHPKGRFIFGDEEVVKNADIEKMRQFYNRGFHPNNMELILAGRLPENVEYLIEQYLGNPPAGESTRKKFPDLSALPDKVVVHRIAKERLNLEKPEESSAKILLAYTAPNLTHLDSYVISMISKILGNEGDTNSRLFQNLGLKKGLAYSVESDYNSSYNTGELRIKANVPATRIEEAVSTIFSEIHELKIQRVDERDIERIKRLIKYEWVKLIESNKGHILAIEMKLDYNITTESYMQGYNNVTADKILEAANKYLPDRETGKYVLSIRNPLLN